MPTPHLRRPSGRSRRRFIALLAIPALVAPMLVTGASPASAEPIDTDPVAAPEPAPNEAEPVAVTLITGDTVYWQDDGEGNPHVTEIVPAERDYTVEFDQSGTPENFYVIPTDTMQHVVAGTVDIELFNIPALVRQGLDDQSAGGELPVIVTFDQDRTPQRLERDANALPAAGNARAVEKINGAGVKVDRGHASRFRDALLGNVSEARMGSQGLSGPITQIQLDQALEIDLAESVPQIGAPQAWAAGYTGDGVTVAVLDTGVDHSHPDLAGQVVADANFTNEPDTTDHHGHGSHVASTIAGTGAASDGVRTGVAPGVELLNGKVCNSDGDCLTSWVMAGMEWAVKQGADIVNLSLGGGPTDGTDSLSELVNTLSASSDTLFVTSAGNTGFGLRKVDSPAAADAALAVGAVDKADQRASFSSRGPRVGDHAVKPELTAPGVGIVAARAAGTSSENPINEYYTSLDGTSMSSPHVAGAAALLAQARGLTGQELKDALVSTATDGGHRWYEQGTGRVDVPASLNSAVYATGTVNLDGINGHVQQEVVYTNHSDSEITLTLAATITDLNGQAFDGVSLSNEKITVPARGQASVTLAVTLDPSDLTGQESFGGVVEAIGPDVVLRTGIGFGPPLHRVNIKVLDSNGDRTGTNTAADGLVRLVRDTFDREVGGTQVMRVATDEGIATGHVPTGVYTVITNVLETDANIGNFVRGSQLVELELDIDSNTTLTLDARDAVPIRAIVPRKVEKRGHQVSLIRQTASSSVEVRIGGVLFPVFVTPTPPAELGSLSLWVYWVLAEPQLLEGVFGSSSCRDPRSCYGPAPAYIYNLPFLYENGIPLNLQEKVNRNELVEVRNRYHSEKPDVLIQRAVTARPVNASISQQDVWIKPGEVTEYFLADDRMTWTRFVSRQYREDKEASTFLFSQRSRDRFLTAEAGTRRDEEHWFEGPLRVGVADLREEHLDNPINSKGVAVAARGGPDGNWFMPGSLPMDNSRGHFVVESGDRAFASWRMWHVGTATELEMNPAGSFLLLPGEATYQLDQSIRYPVGVGELFRTGPATTTWTFTSRPSNAHVPDGYRCDIRQAPREEVCQIQPLIQLEYQLGLDLHNQAQAGRAHRFTIIAGHHSKAIDRAPVTSLQIQASFDGGKTWRDARVTGGPRDSFSTGGFLPSTRPYRQFDVVLLHPPLYRTDGYVTLRVQAADANGGSIDQTIHHAYILRRR